MIKILDFGADWCAPCRMMKPIIKNLQADYDIEVIDLDENPEEATKYNIRAVPTLVVLLEGVEIDRIVGFASEEKLRDTFEGYGD